MYFFLPKADHRYCMKIFFHHKFQNYLLVVRIIKSLCINFLFCHAQKKKEIKYLLVDIIKSKSDGLKRIEYIPICIYLY